MNRSLSCELDMHTTIESISVQLLLSVFPSDLLVTIELKNREYFFSPCISVLGGLYGRIWVLSICQVKQGDDGSQRWLNILHSCLNFNCNEFFIEVVGRRPWILHQNLLLLHRTDFHLDSWPLLYLCNEIQSRFLLLQRPFLLVWFPKYTTLLSFPPLTRM